MIKTGKIKKITTSPQFKHHQWWVYVIAEDETGQEHKTFVTGSTKLEVIKNSNLGNNVDIIV